MSHGYSVRLIEQNRNADKQLLGVRLGRACIKSNTSVTKVSELLGVSRQTVYNWFSGVSNPQNVLVDAVTKLLATLSRNN
jgi:hypothetical protein